MNSDENPGIIELDDQDKEKSKGHRTGGDRRSIDFYKYYSEEELKKSPPNRRKGDRRHREEEGDQAEEPSE